MELRLKPAMEKNKSRDCFHRYMGIASPWFSNARLHHKNRESVGNAAPSHEMEWQNFNPTKFPLKTHIGIPPVTGTDGIIYGVYETLDITPVDITPPNENMEWTTEVSVPADGKGFYILLSVESNKPRTYKNYALDISDK